MATSYDYFLSLTRISASFSARMVHAGALTALERMAAKQLMHCGEAAEHAAGAKAANTTAQIEALVMGCCAAFGRSVPRVSCLDCYCWKICIVAAYAFLLSAYPHMRYANLAPLCPRLTMLLATLTSLGTNTTS